jgi:hypothetical protein
LTLSTSMPRPAKRFTPRPPGRATPPIARPRALR